MTYSSILWKRWFYGSVYSPAISINFGRHIFILTIGPRYTCEPMFFYLQAVIINEMHIKFIRERLQSKIKHITYINLTQ